MTPIFTLKCDKCGLEEDYIFSVVEDLEANTICDKCGKHINRKDHRIYSPEDAPAVHGQTVVGKKF